MHPVINTHLARAVEDDALRQSKSARSGPQPHIGVRKRARPRPRWRPGWSAEQA